MMIGDRLRERLRWRCRRGLLELDLVLQAFLDRHFDGLDAAGLEAFKSLLARSDPDLLDLVLGRAEPGSARERQLLALMRSESCNSRSIQIS
jgi:antitoxin CptB